MGDGSSWGLNIEYAEQNRPEGLAQAFIIGNSFVGQSNTALILGDNLFYGQGMQDVSARANAKQLGGTIFGYHVSDPERFGVVEFDQEYKAVSIE